MIWLNIAALVFAAGRWLPLCCCTDTDAAERQLRLERLKHVRAVVRATVQDYDIYDDHYAYPIEFATHRNIDVLPVISEEQHEYCLRAQCLFNETFSHLCNWNTNGNLASPGLSRTRAPLNRRKRQAPNLRVVRTSGHLDRDWRDKLLSEDDFAFWKIPRFLNPELADFETTTFEPQVTRPGQRPSPIPHTKSWLPITGQRFGNPVTGVREQGRAKNMVVAYLNRNQAALMWLDIDDPGLESELTLEFYAYQAGHGITLTMSCVIDGVVEHAIVYETSPKVDPKLSRKWRDATATCPIGTTQIYFLCENFVFRGQWSQGSCGITDIRVPGWDDHCENDQYFDHTNRFNLPITTTTKKPTTTTTTTRQTTTTTTTTVKPTTTAVNEHLLSQLSLGQLIKHRTEQRRRQNEQWNRPNTNNDNNPPLITNLIRQHIERRRNLRLARRREDLRARIDHNKQSRVAQRLAEYRNKLNRVQRTRSLRPSVTERARSSERLRRLMGLNSRGLEVTRLWVPTPSTTTTTTTPRTTTTTTTKPSSSTTVERISLIGTTTQRSEEDYPGPIGPPREFPLYIDDEDSLENDETLAELLGAESRESPLNRPLSEVFHPPGFVPDGFL